MIALMIVQLAFAPWVGLWRFEPVPGQEGALHLVVRDDGEAELYDVDWSPFDIYEFTVEEGRLHLRFTREAKVKGQDLRGTFDGNRFEGSTELLAGGGQFRIEQPTSAVRVLESPPPFSLEWIAEHRKDARRIDVLGFLLRKAPRETFDQFSEFWEQQVEPAYYPYIEWSLYGLDNDPEESRRRLRELYEALPRYQWSDEGLESEVSRNIEEIRRTASGREKALLESVDCLVLTPRLGTSQARFLSVPVERVKMEEGQRPCCGARGFRFHNFLIVPIGPPPDGKPEAGNSKN